METMEIIRIIAEGVGVIALAFFTGKTFRFKGIILTIIRAAKDARITETEFQDIVDEVKKEIYGA